MDKETWKIAAQRSTVGPESPIAAIAKDDGAYTVRPRKYSVRANDELNALAIRKQAAMKGKAREKVLALGLDPADLEPGEGASEEAKAAAKRKRHELSLLILEGAEPELLETRETMRLKLLYGIHAHNFYGDPIGPDAEWADGVLEDPALAAEIVKIVEDFNRPLAHE